MVEESVSTSRMESSRGKIRFPQAMVASRLHTGFRIQGLMFKVVPDEGCRLSQLRAWLRQGVSRYEEYIGFHRDYARILKHVAGYFSKRNSPYTPRKEPGPPKPLTL